MKYIVEYKAFQKRNHQLINEGFAQGVVTDVVQFLISGAAEYGITAATLGVGTPAAVAVETMIDASFAGATIGLALKKILDMKGKLQEFTDLVNKCMESFEIFKQGDFKKFYKQIKNNFIEGLKLIEGSEKNVDRLAQKLARKISDLISQLTDGVVKGLKILIPDAALGASLSVGIKLVLNTVSKNGYNLAIGAVNKLGEYKKYLIDPEQLPKLIEKSLPALYELIDAYKKKIEELGWLKAITFFGSKGLILKQIGPAGLDTLKNMIKSSEPKVLELIEKILTVIVPVTFTLLAIYQILMKQEYKADNKKVKTEDK